MTWSIFAVSVRDRVGGTVLAAATVALLLWFGLAVYGDLDLSFYYEMPPALLDTIGVSVEAGGVGGVAFGAMYNLMGAMTMAGLAIAIGSAAIAGEEQAGTLGLLLSTPRSRESVLLAKTGALVVLTVAGGVLLWAAGELLPAAQGVDVGNLHVGALVVHLSANALLWGMLALAVGAWTGQPTIASGTAAGLMVASWLAASLLPLVGSGNVADTAARLVPWSWFSRPAAEVNGLDPAYLSVQLGACIALGAVAMLGLTRRDLRSGAGRVTLLDRLRRHPRTQALADRLGGQARVSSITVKTATEHQTMAVVIAAVLFYLGLLMPFLYRLLPDGMSELFAQLPEELIAMIGGVDMATPSGFLQGEVFSIMVPIAMITLTASVGARALAGEEEARTMGLLLANPLPRWRIVLAKAGAMVLLTAVVGLVLFGASAIGVLLSGIDVSYGGLGAISALGAMLALVVGAVALLVGAATGRSRWAVGAAAAVGLVSYVVQSFLPLSPTYGGWARAAPFYYFLSGDPLVNGMPWGHAAVLLAAFVVLVALAMPAFQRRDVRG